MSKVRLIIAALITTGILAFSGSALVFADCSSGNFSSASGAIQCGATTANGGQGSTTDATTQANSLISSILNILTVGVGIIAVVMIIVAGYYYITSSGNQEKVTTAKRTLIYAIIGLVIAALAKIIAQFVVHRVT